MIEIMTSIGGVVGTRSFFSGGGGGVGRVIGVQQATDMISLLLL